MMFTDWDNKNIESIRLFEVVLEIRMLQNYLA